MKQMSTIFFVPIMVLGLLLSCSDDVSNDDKCITRKTENVTSVNSPSTGMVNETINIEVNFVVDNGCGGFGKFIETHNNNNINIEVEAIYEGCACTFGLALITVIYEFTPNSVGNYVLKFKSSPTDFIPVELTIN